MQPVTVNVPSGAKVPRLLENRAFAVISIGVSAGCGTKRREHLVVVYDDVAVPRTPFASRYVTVKGIVTVRETLAKFGLLSSRSITMSLTTTGEPIWLVAEMKVSGNAGEAGLKPERTREIPGSVVLETQASNTLVVSIITFSQIPPRLELLIGPGRLVFGLLI